MSGTKSKKRKTLYRLVSSENSDSFYVFSVQSKNFKKDFTLRKFDKKARKHLTFSLKKI